MSARVATRAIAKFDAPSLRPAYARQRSVWRLSSLFIAFLLGTAAVIVGLFIHKIKLPPYCPQEASVVEDYINYLKAIELFDQDVGGVLQRIVLRDVRGKGERDRENEAGSEIT